MKQSVILVALWCIFLSITPTYAQTNFEETYKKARAFTRTNQDSALVSAKKSLRLAQASEQKYKACYSIAYNANRLCLTGMATLSYQKALTFATTPLTKHKTMNNLAKTYFNTGNYAQATKLNQQSIAYFEKTKKGYELSYAYELKSFLLSKQQDYTAFSFLRKALQLRQQYAPKDIGFAYAEMAKAFAHFNIYDSAIIYRQKALANYPLKSPDKIATQHILLAKYLLFNKQTAQALPHLQQAQQLAKQPFTELFWCHTFGLYFMQTNATPQADHTFAYCDSLLQKTLNNAPDVITRKTISLQAMAMYNDALELKGLNRNARQNYQHQLDIVQVNLHSANRELKAMDNSQKEILEQLNTGSPAHTPLYFWWAMGFSIIIAGLGIWFWRKAKRMAPTDAEKEAAEEKELIRLINEALDKAKNKDKTPEEKSKTSEQHLDFIERETIKQLYHGYSYNDIAKDLKKNKGRDVTKASLNVRMNRLAKQIGDNTMLELIERLKAEIKSRKS